MRNILTIFFLALAVFFSASHDASAVASNSTVSLEVVETAAPETSEAPAPIQANGPPVGEEPALSQAFAPIEIVFVSAKPGLTSGLISWTTNHPASAKISWGKTPVDKMGSFDLTDFAFSRTFSIPNLEPGTSYFFSIEARDSQEKSARVTGQQFTTLSVPRETLAPNVNNFVVEEQDADARLSWENPVEPLFDSVRIVRSTNFFPEDILDGKVIYEGSGEEFLDSEVVSGKRYFYSVFAKTKDGRYSSGAVARFMLGPRGEPIVFPDREGISQGAGTPLELPDFYITQSPLKDARFVVSQGVPVLVSVPTDRISLNVKTIILTFPDWGKKNTELSYMLRLNEAKNAYEAVLPPFKTAASFPFFFEIYGRDNEPVKMIPATFVVVENIAQNGAISEEISSSIVGFSLFIFLALLLAIFLRKLYTVFFA